MRWLGLLLAAVLVGCTGAPAAAASARNCAPRGVMVAQLAATYGETRQSIGLAGSDQVVEVFASLETGSWSILITKASGLACMVAAGRNFEQTAEPVGDPA